MVKKFLFLSLFCTALFAGWNIFVLALASSEEGKNIFSSPLYAQYRMQLNGFVSQHPLYEKAKNSTPTKINLKIKSLVAEIEKTPATPNEQRASHESIINAIRDIIGESSIVKSGEKDTREFFQSLIHFLFLEEDLQSGLESFLKNYAPSHDENFFSYLREAQITLHDNPQFNGMKNKSSIEDQFFQGNLPYTVAIINGETKLFRLGQPISHASRLFWWVSSPKVSPEFSFFLQTQPNHLYVNLMKRHGVEGTLTSALENLENEHEQLYFITLDKNSSFYWQSSEEYPDLLESGSFKKEFLDQMSLPGGHYFWSKHLSLWGEELKQIVDKVHRSCFNNSTFLNRNERQDFIELTYLGILNHLVGKWNPPSMNITCRQGMDRGPSLAALWIYEKGLLSNIEIAAHLLTPPLLIQNRSSHGSRIQRFISAAKRIKKHKEKQYA